MKNSLLAAGNLILTLTLSLSAHAGRVKPMKCTGQDFAGKDVVVNYNSDNSLTIKNRRFGCITVQDFGLDLSLGPCIDLRGMKSYLTIYDVHSSKNGPFQAGARSDLFAIDPSGMNSPIALSCEPK